MAADSNLFSVPATLTDRYRVEEERIGPQAAVTEDMAALGEINFFVPASSHGLIALSQLGFELEMSIRKKKTADVTWSAITDDDKVAPVNLISHSIFQSVQVMLNNRMISDTACHYPYRAMFEILTTANREAARTQLSSAGFYMDTPGQMNNISLNHGERERRQLFIESEYVQFSGILCFGGTGCWKLLQNLRSIS